MSLHILTFCLLILVTTATAQINVLINVDHQEVCTPAIIQFSDSSVSSLSPIIQWEWSINGAVFSTLQNPALRGLFLWGFCIAARVVFQVFSCLEVLVLVIEGVMVIVIQL